MGRRAVVLVIALVLAAAAAFAIFQYLSNVEEAIVGGQEQVPVYRAMDLIQEGTSGDTILGGANILYQEGFEEVEDLPEGAITTPAALEQELRGQVAVGPVPKNGILTASQWVTPDTSLQPLKESIATGKQALTISPGDIQGVNGFAQPGDLINVIVTLDLEVGLTAGAQAPDFGVPGSTGTNEEGESEALSVIVPYSRFVLQNLKVLAVGQEIAPSPDAAEEVVNTEGSTAEDTGGAVQTDAAQPQTSTVYTIEVDPSQAERLVYAIQNGSIYLTLVPDDNQPVATQGVTIETLFEGDLLDDIFQ